jgi:hypothetical protein
MLQKTILKQHQENHEKYKYSISEYDIHEDKHILFFLAKLELP